MRLVEAGGVAVLVRLLGAEGALVGAGGERGAGRRRAEHEPVLDGAETLGGLGAGARPKPARGTQTVGESARGAEQAARGRHLGHQVGGVELLARLVGGRAGAGGRLGDVDERAVLMVADEVGAGQRARRGSAQVAQLLRVGAEDGRAGQEAGLLLAELGARAGRPQEGADRKGAQTDEQEGEPEQDQGGGPGGGGGARAGAALRTHLVLVHLLGRVYVGRVGLTSGGQRLVGERGHGPAEVGEDVVVVVVAGGRN